MRTQVIAVWLVFSLGHLSVAQNVNRSNVERQLDIDYAGTDNPKQKLDLYFPKKRNSDKPLPVIAYIHGGAWRVGDKSRAGGRVIPYANSGNYIGVSIGYRLSGEAKWPAQIHDCKAAIRWLKANASRLNLDPKRIGVMGSSAGGHLVAVLGTSGDVKELEGNVGRHLDHDSSVACVVNEYGPTDFLRMNDFPSRIDHDAVNSPESQLIGGAIQDNRARSNHASPLTYVSKGDAPQLLIHGTKDPLVPFNQSELLANKLTQAGVSNMLLKMIDGGHGGFRSPELTKRTIAFFDKHLREKDVEISKEPIQVTRRR